MLFTAFVFGLISSLHCVGMCGPIALMLPVAHHNKAKKISQLITYHMGRISAYAIIGFVFGLLGKGFFIAGIQQQLSILVGVIIILLVFIPSKLTSKYNFSKPIFKFLSNLKTTLGSQFKNKTYKSFYTIGLLNGFLPCGMVYVALFGAIAMQSALFGSVYMMLFGLGTIPLMSIVTFLNAIITNKSRNKIQKIIPYITVFIGVLFIIRGLGLGIPYLSPVSTSLFVQASPNCH